MPQRERPRPALAKKGTKFFVSEATDVRRAVCDHQQHGIGVFRTGESCVGAQGAERGRRNRARRWRRRAPPRRIDRPRALLDLQKPEGFWCGDLLADTTLESDYILLQLWLHPPQGAVWNPPNAERIRKVRRSILERQLPDGGFNIYPGGPADVSASVKAYTALKLAGLDADSEPMQRLRDGDPRARRDSGGEQLRQDQPEPVRAVSAGVRADGAAGAGAAAGAHPV